MPQASGFLSSAVGYLELCSRLLASVLALLQHLHMCESQCVNRVTLKFLSLSLCLFLSNQSLKYFLKHIYPVNITSLMHTHT